MSLSIKKIAILFLFVILPGSVVAWGLLSFFEPRTLYQTDLEPLDVAVGDINSDGYMDVVTANREGFSLSVFMGNGDGTLTEVNAIEGSYGFTSVALTDFDNDSMLDLVASSCTRMCTESGVAIYRGSGDGLFEPAAQIPLAGVAYNVLTADFDNDGRTDIAASDYPGKRLVVLMATGDADLFREMSLPSGVKTIAVQSGDLNNDGLPDLISSDHGSAASSVYLSLGAEGFADRIEVPTGKLPYSIALDHLDDDPYLDLAVAHSTNEGGIRVFGGRGDGSFVELSELSAPDPLVYITSADINRDQLPDLVTSHQKHKYVSVYLNQGDGRFATQPIRVPSENHVYSLMVTDLNADPYPDLITVDFKANTLSVALGQNPQDLARIDDPSPTTPPPPPEPTVAEPIQNSASASVDLQDTPLKDALRILSELSGLNIVLMEPLELRITFSAIEESWEELLVRLATQYRLRIVIEGNLVKVYSDSTGQLLKTDAGTLYQGRLISLDLQDTELGNALQIIEEVANLPIERPENFDQTQQVTIRLIDLPWDQALAVILEQFDYIAEVSETTIIIGPIDEH